MVRKTRFLLASKLPLYRDHHGAFQAFKEARNNAHGDFREKVLVDGLDSYNRVSHANVKGWNPVIIQNAGIRKPKCDK
jgi:hypothetical protein